MKKELAAIFLGASLLYGCSTKMGVFENRPVKYYTDPITNEVIIYSTEDNGYVKFSDGTGGVWREPKDGRIDEVTLVNVNKGDSLESLANLEVGQKILKTFLDKSN